MKEWLHWIQVKGYEWKSMLTYTPARAHTNHWYIIIDMKILMMMLVTTVMAASGAGQMAPK